AIDQSVGLFFFQAEDGIRDATVTGVQTCALPISSKSPSSEITFLSANPHVTPSIEPPRSGSRRMSDRTSGVRLLAAASIPAEKRSEERRVGKECRWGEDGAGWQEITEVASLIIWI